MCVTSTNVCVCATVVPMTHSQKQWNVYVESNMVRDAIGAVLSSKSCLQEKMTA